MRACKIYKIYCEGEKRWKVIGKWHIGWIGVLYTEAGSNWVIFSFLRSSSSSSIGDDNIGGSWYVLKKYNAIYNWMFFDTIKYNT